MTRQLGFDAILTDIDAANLKPSPEVRPRDELGETLVAHGLVPNEFILDLNHSLTVPYDMQMPPPWNLPSRMFRFPVETTGSFDKIPRRIGLMHPLLAEHPFVLHVENKLGFPLDSNGAPNDHGYSKQRLATWWHAVDLVSAGMWKDLLATERFTTPDDIAGAVAYGLCYSREKGKPCLTTLDARKIMTHLKADEPEDRPGLLTHFMRPMPCKADKGPERWPINSLAGSASDKAWAYIASIENGWFLKDRSGFLNWTPKGRDRFAAVVGTEPHAAEADVACAPEAPEEPEPIAAPREPTHVEKVLAGRAKPVQLSLF